MKKLLLTLALLILSASSVLADGFKQTELLPSLIKAALDNNPELKTSQSRWRMFQNRVAQAGSLDDPMLMLKIQNGVLSDPLNFSKEPMTAKVIGISQQLPFWGKRGLREEIAAKDAESYRWQVEERKLELVRMVKETYYRIYFTDKSLEIVAKNIKTLDDFITLAEIKYSVAQGAQQDVFKSQVERSKLLDMQITLQQERKSLEATLNALLSRPSETTVGTIPDFEIKPLPLLAKNLSSTAFEKRPIVKSLSAQIEKGEASHKLAGKNFYPDFNVSMEYMQRDPAMGGEGLDMYSLGVTFNLPLQRARRHAMVAESDSEVRMATDEMDSLRNSIDSNISDLLAKLNKREKLVELYKTGIIPQAEQSLDSATIGYRVNKVDFLSLLDSRVTLFNYERELYQSKAEYMLKLAELEAVVGIELEESLSAPTIEKQTHIPVVTEPGSGHVQHH